MRELREPGHYWVQYVIGRWDVVYYFGRNGLVGQGPWQGGAQDSDFYKIGNRITPPGEQSQAIRIETVITGRRVIDYSNLA
jgi:hypothetical protein